MLERKGELDATPGQGSWRPANLWEGLRQKLWRLVSAVDSVANAGAIVDSLLELDHDALETIMASPSVLRERVQLIQRDATCVGWCEPA